MIVVCGSVSCVCCWFILMFILVNMFGVSVWLWLGMVVFICMLCVLVFIFGLIVLSLLLKLCLV